MSDYPSTLARKYLNFIDCANLINSESNLTHYETELLNVSAKRHLSGDPITAGHLIRQKSIASQVTLQLALKNLIHKKMLSMQCREEDRRVKHVLLTKMALTRYKKLYLAIRKASKG